MRNRQNYPAEWHDVIRPEILKRAKYKCENCGLVHRKTYLFYPYTNPILIDKEELQEAKANGEKAYTIFLQISHQDHDTTNNDYSNLKALCQKCHLNYDRNFHKLVRKSNKNNQLKNK